MANAHNVYLFECKGIQRYVFGSGRLRQVVGASDIVTNIANSQGDDTLDAALNATGTKESVILSRRAGASFCLHAEEADSLERFRRLWRLAFGISYPGLEFVDGTPASGETPMKAEQCAYRDRTAVRENSAAFLPPTGHPFVAPNPRTGLPAVCELPEHEDQVLLDAVGAPQHRPHEDSLAERFLSEADAKTYRFPRHFERREEKPDNPAFPFADKDKLASKDKRVGYVHADLSGLGKIFHRVKENASQPNDVFKVAKSIEDAVTEAARSACKSVLLRKAKSGVIPARPVLLGGDDVTVIVRADLAVAFAEKFLRALEEKTARSFDDLRARYGSLPARLSACAGIAVVSANHPFQAAARLAEGLCDSAKKMAKANCEPPYPSFLEFAVATSTIDEKFEDWRAREQKIPHEDMQEVSALLTAAGPRRVGGELDAEALESLLQLAEALYEAGGRGKLMEAFALRYDSKSAAETPWKRFWTVLKHEDEKTEEKLRRALTLCAPGADDGVPDFDSTVGVMSDALELIDIRAVPREDGGGNAQ